MRPINESLVNTNRIAAERHVACGIFSGEVVPVQYQSVAHCTASVLICGGSYQYMISTHTSKGVIACDHLFNFWICARARIVFSFTPKTGGTECGKVH